MLEAVVWMLHLSPPELTTTQKLVGIMLANRANREDGMAFPSVELLAEECNCSENTVRAALKGLQEHGVIRLAAKATRYTPNCYIFTAHDRGEIIPVRGSESEALRGAIRGAKSEPKLNSNDGDTPSVVSPGGLSFDDDLWKPYPRTNRGPKDKAAAAWAKLSESQRQAAVDALPAWSSCGPWQRGYVNRCDRWLSGEMWENDPPQDPRPGTIPNGRASILDGRRSEMALYMEQAQGDGCPPALPAPATPQEGNRGL